MKRPARDWFPVVRHHWWELLIFRLLMAWLLWTSIPQAPFSYDSTPAPNGLALVFPVEIFHDAAVLKWTRMAAFVGLCLFVAGRWLWLALPVVAIASIGPTTLANSQGSIHHNLQLAHTAFVVIALWHLGVAARNRFFSSRFGRLERAEALELEAHFAKQAIAAGYVVSAVTKLINSEGAWISQAQNFSLQIRKTSEMYRHNFDQLPEATLPWLDRVPRYLEELILTHPWTGSWILAPGLIIELFAFLALLGRRSALVAGLCILLLHFTIGKVMHLHFQANIFLVTVYFVNLPYLACLLAGHLRRLVTDRRQTIASQP